MEILLPTEQLSTSEEIFTLMELVLDRDEGKTVKQKLEH
jgi:hypothetical protein